MYPLRRQVNSAYEILDTYLLYLFTLKMFKLYIETLDSDNQNYFVFMVHFSSFLHFWYKWLQKWVVLKNIFIAKFIVLYMLYKTIKSTHGIKDLGARTLKWFWKIIDFCLFFIKPVETYCFLERCLTKMQNANGIYSGTSTHWKYKYRLDTYMYFRFLNISNAIFIWKLFQLMVDVTM